MRSEKPHQALVSLLAFKIGRAYGEWFIPRHDVRVMRALAFRTVSFVIENHCDILLLRYTSVLFQFFINLKFLPIFTNALFQDDQMNKEKTPNPGMCDSVERQSSPKGAQCLQS